MNILVTGGLGFVGINVVKELAAQDGVTVVAADLPAPAAEMSTFLAPVAEHVRCVHLDVIDRTAVRHLVEDESITHIVHGAAITASAEEEAARPTPIVDVNLGGTVNVLDAAVAVPSVQRILLISSSGVYALPEDPNSDPMPEEGPLDLTNLYGITKRSAELLATRFSQISGKPMASVRLASVYGPMERPRQSRTRTSLVHRLLTALREHRPLILAGPGVRRDWIHAADVGRAIGALLAAAQWNHPVYNVSSGVATSFAELVAIFAEHGLRTEWIDDPDAADIAMRPGSARTPLDITRLRRDVGFAPSISLREGVADLIADEDEGRRIRDERGRTRDAPNGRPRKTPLEKR